MHVLMTVDAVGGVWTYALDLARALPEHHFTFASLGPRASDAKRENLALLPNVSLQESDYKLEWMNEAAADVAQSGAWLRDLEEELRPDIVHLNGYSHAVEPFRAPKVVVAHSCVASWWRAVKNEDAPPEWDEYKSCVGAGLRAANRVVSPTCALGEELRAIYGDFGPFEIIHNGAGFVDEADLDSKQRFILSCGRAWDEAKNIALLDEIAPHLDWPLRIAGDCSAPDGSRFRSSHLELQGQLSPSSTKQMQREAAIYAHPARYEPFGLAPLEAASWGCALVLSDISTLRELWEDAAIFVSANSVTAWVYALEKLIKNPVMCIEWSNRARIRARTYGLKRFGEGYTALYDKLKSNE